MPEVFREIADSNSVYAIWEITESLEELEGMICLRHAELTLYQAFQVENRKKQWLAYRILIRALLMPEDFPVDYDETGKPFLAGSKYHISVTHSGELAAVIVSSKGLVGIDIEAIRARIERVGEKFLSQEELSEIGPANLHTLLTLAWCAKDALYKLYGHRGLDFRENIRIEIPKAIDSGSFMGQIIHNGKLRNYRLFYHRISDYMLVYVAERPPGNELIP
jgi:phosphopantetheinyl transferase